MNQSFVRFCLLYYKFINPKWILRSCSALPFVPQHSLFHTGFLEAFLEATVEFLCWWCLQSFGVCVVPSPAVPLFMAPSGKNFPPCQGADKAHSHYILFFFWKFLSQSLRNTANDEHLKMVVSVIFHSFCPSPRAGQPEVAQDVFSTPAEVSVQGSAPRASRSGSRPQPELRGSDCCL